MLCTKAVIPFDSPGPSLIARRLVEVAREVGADAVAHGCTVWQRPGAF